MSRYRVTIDGQTYDIEVDDPRARPVRARVAEEIFLVEVEAEDDGTAPAPPAGVSAPARSTVPFSPPPPVAGASAPDALQELTAPIPGTVMSVVVSVGQAVRRGDELLTIEAMKMFNVIRAPWPGTITEVHVSEGRLVSQGELLVTFAPT